MMKKTLLIIIVVFGLFSVMIGCVNLEKSYPEKRYFIMDASRGEDISSSDTDAALTVRRFRVSPKYEGKGLVYRLDDLSYESDFYNEFFIPPASMFT